jgi:hypothetical protein
MSYTRKGTSGVQFFARNKKRKRPIAGSTVATSHFLVWLHEERPDYTINQLRALLLDRRQFLPHPEALAVLDAYIKVGEGDVVPRWR